MQVLDTRREPGLGRVYDEVHMVPHQAQGVAAPAVPFDRVGEEAEISAAVLVIAEDRRAVDAAGGHVEISVGQMRTQDSRHGSRLRIDSR